MTALDDALRTAAKGGAPDTILLMRVLMEAGTEREARDGLAAAKIACVAAGDRAGATVLRRLVALWAATPAAWSAVRGTIGAIAHRPATGTPDATLAYWSECFDRLVAAQPEASVALYSLGSPDLLAATTTEIVDWMVALDLVRRDARVLDFGCGIGRFLAALAPRVAAVLGLDLSAGMVAEARRRCAGFGNVAVRRNAGRDLADLADASFNLVLAADVFPYLVEAGGEIAQRHVVDAARILAPGGALLILNWSYRCDSVADHAEISASAEAAGLSIEHEGMRDFTLWDAATFLLRRPAAGSSSAGTLLSDSR